MALETATVKDVELIKEGRWHGKGCPKNGCEVSLDMLAKIVDAFKATIGKLNPPLKLGHDAHQRLVQQDGYPAAGWITNLRMAGRTLIGDFEKVPRRIAELIAAGGYRARSVEITPGMTVDNVRYPHVLTAVALLGADLPAVDGLADVEKLYSERHFDLERDAIIVLTEGGEGGKGKLDQIISEINRLQGEAEALIHNRKGAPTLRQLQRAYIEGLRRAAKVTMTEGEEDDLVEIGLSVLLEMIWEETENQIRHRVRPPEHFRDGTFRTVKLQGAAGISAVMGRLSSDHVPEGHKPDSLVAQSVRFDKGAGWTMAKAKAWMSDHKLTKEVMDMEIKDIRKALGLPEEGEEDILDVLKTLKEQGSDLLTKIRTALSLKDGDDVVAAVEKLVSGKGGDPPPETAQMGKDLKEAQEKVIALEKREHERDVEAAVDKQIAAGHILPAQKEMALKMAATDLAGFVTFAESQPTLVDTTEKGTSEEAIVAEFALTPADRAAIEATGGDPDNPEDALPVIRRKAEAAGRKLPAEFGKPKEEKKD